MGTGNESAVYPDGTFLSLARLGYERNELVYACIAEKATSMPEAPLRVYGSDGLGEPNENHPLRQLISNPNPVLSEFELFELLVTHLDLAGNAFWQIIRDNAGRPAEIWPMRPDLVRLDVSKGVPKYWYQVGGSWYPIPDCLHFRHPNPVDLYFGQPPLRPALRATTLDNEATNFVTALLQNRAVPGAVITVQQQVDQAYADRLKAQWRQAFGGARRGDVSVLQQGMDVKMLGLNLDQLEFPDLRTISEARICMVLGVPPILIGAKVGLDRSTFANYSEARQSFWEETLMPLQRRISDVIVRRLLPMVEGSTYRRAPKVRVQFDRSEVLALKESEQAIWERANNALRAGAITVADFRRIVGLPYIPGSEVFLRPAGVIPTDAEGNPKILVGGAVSDHPSGAGQAYENTQDTSTGDGESEPASGIGKSGTWERLPESHPDYKQQCPVCCVVWTNSDLADECFGWHKRNEPELIEIKSGTAPTQGDDQTNLTDPGAEE